MDQLAPRFTRRDTVRLLGAAALAAPAALRLRGADAGRVWCRTDPLFAIDGLLVNLYVSGLLDVAYDTSGPINVVLSVPSGVRAEVLAVDPGFGHGYAISIEQTSRLKADQKEIEVRADVMVPAANGGLEINVEWVPDGTVEVADDKHGRTNEWLGVKTKLAR